MGGVIPAAPASRTTGDESHKLRNLTHLTALEHVLLGGAVDGAPEGFSTEAVQTPARLNVTCVTPLGEEVASSS